MIFPISFQPLLATLAGLESRNRRTGGRVIEFVQTLMKHCTRRNELQQKKQQNKITKLCTAAAAASNEPKLATELQLHFSERGSSSLQRG